MHKERDPWDREQSLPSQRLFQNNCWQPEMPGSGRARCHRGCWADRPARLRVPGTASKLLPLPILAEQGCSEVQQPTCWWGAELLRCTRNGPAARGLLAGGLPPGTVLVLPLASHSHPKGLVFQLQPWCWRTTANWRERGWVC